MEWIPIKNKLPPFGPRNVLVFFNGKKEVTCGYAYDPKDGWDTGNDDSIWINDALSETNEIATHWMSLPEKPEDS